MPFNLQEQKVVPAPNPNPDINTDDVAGPSTARLTGTYRLDATRGDDAVRSVERGLLHLSFRNRQRVLVTLTPRLISPTALAIDRRGQSVTIASTRSPQFTFEADGIERTGKLQNGLPVRIRSTLNGDRLVISSTEDRGSEYSVSFEPIDNGRRLRVTRRLTDSHLRRPLVVQNFYEKTSDVARLDIYEAGINYMGIGIPITTDRYFLVPRGTKIVAVLNTDLTTRDTSENDQFTMTVRSPRRYEGATIKGYISRVNRSDRIMGRFEMTLTFNRITLRDGETYRFAGLIETVRTASGETVRVNYEDSGMAVVGELIGDITGRRKPSSIVAALGAGANASSVYAQGKDDLELMSGTEVFLRASRPR